MDKNELHEILSKPFDHEAWLEVLKSVFGVRELFTQPQPIPLPGTEPVTPRREKAKAAFELGNFTTSDGRVIGLYKVEMMPGIGLERNKAGLRAFLSVFRNFDRYDLDGVLIVFTSEQGEKWRLSYVSEIKVLNEDGEIVSQATEPKRYTYLLGPGEKVLTPANQLSKLSGKALSLEDLRNAFSVEALNEAFYQIIAKQFYQLTGGVLKLPSVPKENRRVFQEFAVRLIGRTVFCWFLKVKKSDDGKPLVPESLLSSEALKTNTNYYHTILEPLFFQTLNTPVEKRSRHLPEGCKNVPFLNGGLFEQGPDDFYQPNSTTGLSGNLNTLVIPNEWFENLFSELEKYNFTIDENSVIDVEVSVDPEMLGRIFENLLAEIDPDSGETARKATGSFYTPREIVDYMATESLLQYLHHKTGLAQAKLRPLFNMTTDHAKDVTGESLEFTSENKEALLNALDKVKILDPACGSGAFPMGVLQKMLMALEKLDPECTWWIQRQIDQVENTILKKQITEKLSGASVEYARKMGIIQNSLFGVDIQPIAAEISKLRCFLTLVVDEHIDETQPNRGIEPLPNLEFKFITANTLLKLPEEQDLGGLFNANDDLNTLQKLRNKYLQSCGEEKVKIKEDFGKIQAGIYKQQIDYLGKSIDVNGKAYLVSTWKPFSHVRKDSFGEKASWFDPEWMFGEKEFDVVIGNPPYKQVSKGIFSINQYPYSEGKDKGKQNLYKLFVEASKNLSKENTGIACMIVQSSLLCDLSSKYTRELLLKNSTINQIVEFPKNAPTREGRVFKSVLQGTCVYILSNQKAPESHDFCISINNDISTIKNLTFEKVQQQSIFKLYPETYYIPLVKPGDFKIISSANVGTKPLLNFIDDISQGDANLTGSKQYFTSDNTGIKLYRGRNVQRFYFITEVEEYIKDDFKPEKSKENSRKRFLACQQITGTTDKYRLHFSVTPKNEKYLLGNTSNKLTLKQDAHLKPICTILNSKLLDWIFRKTSTNNHVMGYEIIQFPIPQNIDQFEKILSGFYDLMSFCYSENHEGRHTIEKVMNSVVFSIYFESMLNPELNIIDYVNQDFEELGSNEQPKFVDDLLLRWTHPDNEVRNRIKLFPVKSPDILKPILES